MIKNQFHIILNNYKDQFPVGAIGQVPAVDADISDKVNESEIWAYVDEAICIRLACITNLTINLALSTHSWTFTQNARWIETKFVIIFAVSIHSKLLLQKTN